jgi:hypothetical protein
MVRLSGPSILCWSGSTEVSMRQSDCGMMRLWLGRRDRLKVCDMWTEQDEKELRRLKQKKARNQDTSTRRAMLNWNKSDKGVKARKKYLKNGGNEKRQAMRSVGTYQYQKKMEYRHATFATAAKRKTRWTIEDELKLIELYESGMTASAIAPILGRSLQGIERKLDCLQVRRNCALQGR